MPASALVHMQQLASPSSPLFYHPPSSPPTLALFGSLAAVTFVRRSVILYRILAMATVCTRAACLVL